MGVELADALKAFGLKPHIQDGGAEIIWSEREVDGAKWYYIAAPVGEGFNGTIKLEGKGKAEWWDPVNGTVKSLKAKGWGRMKKVNLDLANAESGFVVFRSGTSSPAAKEKAFAPKPEAGQIAIEGWTVKFPDGWGAPTEPIAASFTIDKGQLGKDLVLDLGKVDFIADVKVNGKSVGVLWTEPYSLNIKDFIQEGENTLTVDVTGTWYNRLAYDASQPEAQRKTWTIAGPAAGSQLHDSGLLGPVMHTPDILQILIRGLLRIGKYVVENKRRLRDGACFGNGQFPFSQLILRLSELNLQSVDLFALRQQHFQKLLPVQLF